MKKLNLFKIATPIFFEILLFMLLGVADIMMLSRYGDLKTASIAVDSVGMSNQLISNVNIFFSFISAGTAVLIAQNVGAKNFEAVKKVSVISLGFNLLIGIVFSIVLVVFGEDLLRALGLTGERLVTATSYIQIVGGFMMIQALLTTSSAIIRSMGDTKVTLKITIGMNVMNVIGDAIFIFGLFGMPALGVKGVAIATTVSRIVALIVMLIYIFKRYIKVHHSLRYFKEPLEQLIPLLKIGVPTAFENLSYNLAQTVLASIILYQLTDLAYTTRIYAWQISWFALLFGVAIGQGTQIMVGQYSGARDFEQADHACMSNFRLSFGIAIVAGTILMIFGKQFIGIYTTDVEILALGASVLFIDGILEPGRTFNLVIISGLRGAGDVFFPTAIGIIFMWSIQVGVSYYLAVVVGLGLPGIWIGMALDEWIRGFIMLARWKSGIWKTKVLAKQVEV